MDFITYLKEAMLAQVPEIIERYEGEVRAESLSEMEVAIKQISHQVGNEMMGQWLAAQDEKYPVERQACQCGAWAKYERRREGMVISLQGRVYYRRAYYRCKECGQGQHPLDRRLNIEPGKMSQEVIKQAALLGIQEAFETSSQILADLTLLELSPNSIRKASLEMGERVAQKEKELKTQSRQLSAQLEARRIEEKPMRLYGSMDGFKIHFRDGWHEMRTGAWWTTSHRKDGTLKADDIEYYVDLLPANEFSDLVWATGFERLASQAQELIFVADGARWIWDIVDEHFPDAIQIIDWYHAYQYLFPVAQSAYADEAQAEKWVEMVKTYLWQGDLDAVISACSEHIRPHLKSTDDPAQKAVTYYDNNRHRMDYPAYRANDYMIGSGTIESACKQIGLERLKIAGARWCDRGGRLLAKARAAFLSGLWHQLQPSLNFA